MAIYEYPVLKVGAELYLGANYFNLSNGAYEPLIEPWELHAVMKQKDIGSSQIINVKSSKMLNLNLTYGVAICLKNILDALDQDSEDWVDEVHLEEIKRKVTIQKSSSQSKSFKYTDMSATEEEKDVFMTPRKKIRRSASRDSSGRHDSEERLTTTTHPDEENQGVSNFETDSFEFQNNIGVPTVVELENFSANLSKFGSPLSKEQINLFTSNATFELGVMEDGKGSLGSLPESMYTQVEGRGRGKYSQMKSTAKFFKKQMNKLSNFKIIDDPPLKIDIHIEGMEPIRGVPIEVSGRRSYELYFEGENEKIARKRKFQLSIISDVYQEGINKIVSLESQLIMTNHSDLDIQIAYAFLTEETLNCDELTEEEILKSKNDYQSLNLIEEFEGGENFKKLIQFDTLRQFDIVHVGQEYRIPLCWFMMSVSIFYRSVIDNEVTYNRVISDIKRTLLEKGVTKKSLDDNIPQYNFL